MNIFVLDEDPEMAARYHCDKHVPKMLVEYGQILSTAAWKADFHNPDRMYKPVPDHNPDVHDWAAGSWNNYVWLLRLARELYDEYEHRYGAGHKSYDRVISKIDISEVRIPEEGITERPLSMPDTYKVDDDPVKSYRKFYAYGKGWKMSWSNREVPSWYKDRGEVNEIPTQK